MTKGTRLEERISDVQKLKNTQLDLMNQLMLANQKLNHKDVKISNLNSRNDILKNELKNWKQSMEKLKEPKEAIKYFEELMNSSCCSNGS